MQRRKFILNTVLAAPILSIATLTEAHIKPVSKGFVVKAKKDRFSEPLILWGSNPNLVKVSGKDTDARFCMFEYEGFTKMGPSLHLHINQDESFYVLEGQYLFQLGEEKHKLEAGDTIFLPRNIPHTWLQLTSRGKLMYMVQPAGKMEEFFKKVNSLKGAPSEEELQKIHVEHGMKIVGPPLKLE